MYIVIFNFELMIPTFVGVHIKYIQIRGNFSMFHTSYIEW